MAGANCGTVIRWRFRVKVAKLVHGSWNICSFCGGSGESATVLVSVLDFDLDFRCNEESVVKHMAHLNNFSISLSSAMIREAAEGEFGATGSDSRATSASARSAQ